MALILLAVAGAGLVVAGFALSPWPWMAFVVAGAALVVAAYLIAEEAPDEAAQASRPPR